MDNSRANVLGKSSSNWQVQRLLKILPIFQTRLRKSQRDRQVEHIRKDLKTQNTVYFKFNLCSIVLKFEQIGLNFNHVYIKEAILDLIL